LPADAGELRITYYELRSEAFVFLRAFFVFLRVSSCNKHATKILLHEETRRRREETRRLRRYEGGVSKIPYQSLKSSSRFSPRCGVFLTAKGGFAENARASRPLRCVCVAKDAKPLRSLRSLCALSVYKKHRNAVKAEWKILRLAPVFWTPHPIPHTLYPIFNRVKTLVRRFSECSDVRLGVSLRYVFY
jgi:hypothetical protein